MEARSDGVGRGAEFIVRLPALEAGFVRESMGSCEVHAAAAEVSVLVVEDNVDAAESLMMLLEYLGHRVRIAHDGETALRAALVSPPDVMLVDIGLPGMDGYEVARRLRADAGLRTVRLVALTGYGRDEDQERALNAGFDHHLVKPVEIEALQQLIAPLGILRVPPPLPGS